MVISLDLALERVISTLKEENMWKNTVFIFSSDNGGKLCHGNTCGMGGASNGFLRGEKGMLFDGGVRVVGFMRSRQHFRQIGGPRPVQFNGLMHLIDWMPTMYSMSKCPAKVKFAQSVLNGEKIDGISQWSGIMEEVRKNSINGFSKRNVYGDFDRIYRISRRKELLHHLGSKKLEPELNEEQRRFFSQCTIYNLKTTPQVAIRKNYYQDYRETRLVASFKLLIRAKSDLENDDDDMKYGKRKSSDDFPETSQMYLFDVKRDPYERNNLISLDKLRQQNFPEKYRYYTCKLLDRLAAFRRQVPRHKKYVPETIKLIKKNYPFILVPSEAGNGGRWKPIDLSFKK